MITVIRERLLKSKIVAYSLFVMLAIAFVVPGLIRQFGENGFIAKINGQEIGARDYARKVMLWENQIAAYRQQFGQYADMILQMNGLSTDPAKLALEALISEELINQSTQKLDFHFHSEYREQILDDSSFVAQYLGDLIPFYVSNQDGSINEKMLQNYLKRVRLSKAGLEYRINQALARKQLLDLVVASSYAPEFQITEHVLQEKAQKQFSLLKFSFEDFLDKAKKQEISSEDLQNFFDRENQQKHMYFIPEKREGLFWTFSPDDYGIVIEDKDIRNHYEKNKNKAYIDQPVQVQVRTIVIQSQDEENKSDALQKAQDLHAQALKSPKTFAQLASEFSQDKATAKNGGLMEPFAKGSQEAVFERAAFLLQNDGDISDVLTTKKGFEIIQRVKRTKKTYKSLEDVQKDIQKKLIVEKFSLNFAQEVKQASLNDAAWKIFLEQKKGKKQILDVQEQDVSKTSKTLFSLGVNNKVGFVEKNKGIVVMPTKIHSSYLPELSTIEDTVKEDLYTIRAQEKLKKTVESALQKAGESTFDDIANELSASLYTTDFVTKDDIKDKSTLQRKGFPFNAPVDEMMLLEKAGLKISHLSETDGFLIQLNEIKVNDLEDSTKSQNEAIQQIKQQFQSTSASGFVASLYRDATIVVNILPTKS